MPSSATLQTPYSPQILQLAACLLACFYSAPLVEFYSALDSYCQFAWDLGGEGLYIGHVAHIAVDENDKTTAIRMLQIAMSGKMDDREKDQTASDLQKLGVDHPQAIVALTSISVPAREVAPGSADFILLFAGNQPPQVKWIGGDNSLAHFENAISQASFPPQNPDDGPEHVTRLGRMVCTQTECKLELMYSWSESVIGPDTTDDYKQTSN